MTAFLQWWLIAQLLGLAALPLTRRIFHGLPDGGYAFSKAVGLLLVSYLLWLGAVTGVLVNDAGGITLALLVTAALSAWSALRGGWPAARHAALRAWRTGRGNILAVEVLFLLAFAAWTILRAYTPEKILPSGGEKYMEIAFLNGILNSPRFPPLDPWLSGYAISYYYFGYVMMAVVTRVSGVLPAVGFDLYDALTFALTLTCAYGVVFNLTAAASGRMAQAAGAGLLGGLFVTVLGNLEGLVHALYSAGVLPAGLVNWLAVPGLSGDPQSGSLYPGHGYWWWWRASRILNDLDLNYQPVPFQPISEFPFFSFLLGDNHPHKLALPFVLLAVGLAFNTLLRARESGPSLPAAWLSDLRAQPGLTLFSALVLGGLAFLNTWDFPIYLALTVLAWTAGKLLAGAEPGWGLWAQALLRGLALGAVSILLYSLFFAGFSSQAGGVLPYIFPPTHLVQYLLMFEPFIFILAVFLARAARASDAGTPAAFPWRAVLRAWGWIVLVSSAVYLTALGLGAAALALMDGQGALAGYIQPYLGGRTPAELILAVLSARLANPWLFLVLSVLLALAVTIVLRAGCPPAVPTASVPAARRSAPTVFAALLALAGVGLTLIPEFFYLRDSFGMRMNTVFKFYFQGWVLMACASAYGWWWAFRALPTPARATLRLSAALRLAASLLAAAGMAYPLLAGYSRVEGFTNPPNLDAAATVQGFYPNRWAAQPDDWAAVEWLLRQGRGPGGELPVILEAPGESYQHTSRISAFTGFPTLLGWQGHEWQWRGSAEIQDRHLAAARSIYTSPSGALALDELRRWNVRFVIVGEVERIYITRTCQDPAAPCSPSAALRKFDEVLTPVFTQGAAAIYAVPAAPLP